MKVLVLGGTTFFGRRLVHLLINEGHEITVATRGRSQDDFGDAVTRIKVDRTDQNEMIQAFGHSHYDIVYDQICFNPREAKLAVEAFGDRVGRYIFTSSMAVYGHKEDEITEEDFSPNPYHFDLEAEHYSYAEGKRQAEAYFFQKASFPVVAVRVAMVVSGTDDYTGRFDFYVRHVSEDESIGVVATEHPITYVTAWDVAAFLNFLGTRSDFVGPINAANSGYLSIQELSRKIGTIIDKTPRFHVGSHEAKTLSPYAMFPFTWKVSNEHATAIGFKFPSIRESIPSMVQESVQRLGLKDSKDEIEEKLD